MEASSQQGHERRARGDGYSLKCYTTLFIEAKGSVRETPAGPGGPGISSCQFRHPDVTSRLTTRIRHLAEQRSERVPSFTSFSSLTAAADRLGIRPRSRAYGTSSAR